MSQSRERPDHVELARPVHRVVDLRIRVEDREALDHPVRPRIGAADVALVEDHHRLFVLRIGERPRLFVLAQRRLDLGRQLRAQLRQLAHPRRHRGRRALDDQRDEPVRLRGRVLHPEHPAPRVPEEVDPLEPERLADDADLLDEQLRRPHRRVVRFLHRRVPCSELVVEDDAPLARQRLVRLHVQPVRARAAVQAEQRDRVTVLRLDRAPPGLVAVERNPAFRLHAGVYI